MTAARKEVQVDPKVFDPFAGEYELEQGFTFVITREGAHLMAQANGQPKVELFPESGSKFFFKVVNAQIAFRKNQNGVVEKLILYQGGREIPGKKVK